MRLLSHLIASDLRRLRVPMAAWVIVAVAAAFIEYCGDLIAAGSPRAASVEMAAWLMWLAGLLLSSALVAMVMQLHPATGSEAFWMTRPISPPLLLLAKLLPLAILFVGVPVIVEQVEMAVHRMPGADMARVGLQTALNRTLLVTVLAAAAALTPNFARFALLCGLGLVAMAVLPLVLMTFDAWWPETHSGAVATLVVGSSSSLHPWPPGDQSASIVSMSVLLLGAATTVAVQYRRRRLRDSLGVLAGGLLLSFAITAAWPTASRPVVDAPDWAADGTTMRIEVDPARGRLEKPMAWSDAPANWMAHIPARMSAPPAGWLAAVRFARGDLDTGQAGKYPVLASGAATLPDLAGGDATIAELQRLLGVQRLWGWTSLDSAAEKPGLTLYVPPATISETEPRQGRFHGSVAIDLSRVETVGAVPLRPGAVFQDGAYRLIVVEAREGGGALQLRTLTTFVMTAFDREVRPVYALFLRHLARQEAIGPAGGGFVDLMHDGSFTFSSMSIALATPAGFAFEPQTTMFDPRQAPAMVSVIDRQWLQDAELVIVRGRYAGTVQRGVEMIVPLTPSR